MLRRPGYSFCIISGGHRPEKLVRFIDSIHAQHIPEYEIVVAGIAEEREDITYVPMAEAAENGRTSVLRNAAAERSCHQHIAFADDDLVLLPGWFDGLEPHVKEADLLTTRLINPDGTRHWDWATHGGPMGHRMLDYGKIDSHLYLTSGLLVVRASVWESIRWDEELGFQESEDIDFSQRAFQAGHRVHFCNESITLHDDPRYTQVGRVILQRSTRGVRRWCRGDLARADLDVLLQTALEELKEGRIADAADCLRAALLARPDHRRASRLWGGLVRRHGGSTDSGDWISRPWPMRARK
jgi:glycosyltransferase involved in cell wall biosynthesis